MSKIKAIRAPKGLKFKISKECAWNSKEVIEIYFYLKPTSHKFTSKFCDICKSQNEICMDCRHSIGNVMLEKYDDNEFITHSELHDPYRGNGLGTLMYAKAIQYCHKHGYKVTSSGDSSEYAKRVWMGKGLKKFFKIKTKYHNYTSAEEKKIPYLWIPTPKK